jgi:hypothetical protein
MDDWNVLRDYLWLFGAPYRSNWIGDGRGINPEKRVYAYRISTAMNLMQENYAGQMSVVGQQGRNLAERVCCLLEPSGGYPPQTNLNAMINAQTDDRVKPHLHTLRMNGNNADHEGTRDFTPQDKAACVDAAFLCARIVKEHLDTKYPQDATRAAAWVQQAAGGDSAAIRMYLKELPQCVSPLLNAGWNTIENLKELRDGLLTGEQEWVDIVKELGLAAGFRMSLMRKLKATSNEDFISLLSGMEVPESPHAYFHSRQLVPLTLNSLHLSSLPPPPHPPPPLCLSPPSPASEATPTRGKRETAETTERKRGERETAERTERKRGERETAERTERKRGAKKTYSV